jgi:hypothetical protein
MIAWIACRLGYPLCHMEYRDGMNFAICNYCSMQSEIHALGGPHPRDFLAAWHYVEIDCEYGCFRFVCEAPEGSYCRMLPRCQHTGGGCVDYEGDHAIVCTEKDRVLVDTGECTIEPWIENGEECGRGSVRIPVTTEWSGDWWLWRPRGSEREDSHGGSTA